MTTHERLILSIAAVLIISIAAVVLVKLPQMGTDRRDVKFDAGLPLQRNAVMNDIPVKKIQHELSHTHPDAYSWPVKGVPVSKLPVETSEVRSAVEHAVQETTPLADVIKVSLWAAWLAFVLFALHTRKHFTRVRTFAMLAVTVVFGLATGSTLNPMEAAVKFFKWMEGLEGEPAERVVFFAVFLLMAVVGNKLICGWACYLGALQDFLWRISPFKKIKRAKIPFAVTNTIRIVLHLAFFTLLFGWLFGISGFVVYHQVNYFKVFNWDLATFALYTLPVLFLASFLNYRPYCLFICPFGLYAWLVENLSINRVRVREDKCIHCDACVKACPTTAMKGRMHSGRRFFLPDCWACGACVDACPTDAVVFGPREEGAVTAMPPELGLRDEAQDAASTAD